MFYLLGGVKIYNKVIENIVLREHDKGILNKNIYLKYKKYLTQQNIRDILKNNNRKRNDYLFNTIVPMAFYLVHRKGYNIRKTAKLLNISDSTIYDYCRSKCIIYPINLFKNNNKYVRYYIKKYLDTKYRNTKNSFIITDNIKNRASNMLCDTIIELNKKKISIEKMRTKYNIKLNYKEIDSFLYFNNIKVLGEEKLNYSSNPNFFETIDSEEKAYWLGFLLADGCVINKIDEDGFNRAHVQLTLQRKDRGHLIKFKKFTNTHRKISDYLVDEKYPTSSLVFSSKKVVEDLIKHGVVPNKSLIAKFPSNIPNDLKRHFVRGLVDGDGGIPLKNGTPCGFSFCGAYDVVKKVQSFLNIEDKYVKVKNREDFLEIRINKIDVCYKILNTLYSNCNVYLNRKYKRYQKFLEYYNKRQIKTN